MDEFKKLHKNILPHKYFRGMIGEASDNYIKVFENAKVGDVIIPDKGFAFASKSIKEAASYATNEWRQQVLTEIVTPPGTRVSKRFSHLKEVMFPANAKYQVLSKTNKDGRLYLKLKYILPD